MGEAQVALFTPSFNVSARIVRSVRALTEDTGSLLLREASYQLGLDALLGGLPDARHPDYTTYSLGELVRTRVLLLAQGWGDQGDADTLRFDPALRLAVSDRAGEAPLDEGARLPSQPTLSRMQHSLASERGTRALGDALSTVGLRRIRKAEARRKRLVLDIDTFPCEVFGHQDGASYNGHYRVTCFQPLVVLAETGDVLAVQLRGGANPTGDESFALLERVLDGAKKERFDVTVRMDCGFANGRIMAGLDDRRVRFITRLRTTDALHKATDAWYTRVTEDWKAHPTASGEPRTATHELWERVQKNARVRRIIAVTVEPRPGELFPKRFYLCTNMARTEGGSAALLALYRQRGTAEGHIGELVRGTVPSLRAVPRGRDPKSVTIADNNVALLLAALAYQLMHHLRRGIERVQGVGWSLTRLRESILKVATSVVRHSRRVFFRISETKAALWEEVARAITPGAQLALEVVGS